MTAQKPAKSSLQLKTSTRLSTQFAICVTWLRSNLVEPLSFWAHCWPQKPTVRGQLPPTWRQCTGHGDGLLAVVLEPHELNAWAVAEKLTSSPGVHSKVIVVSKRASVLAATLRAQWHPTRLPAR